MSKIESRLKELAIVLPTPPAPVASYVPYVVTGNLVFISGQVTATQVSVLTAATAAGLVVVLEPVPAARWIGLLCLRGVQHEEITLQARLVHARARGEVVGVLGAAVQHHHHRQCLTTVAWWHIELVLERRGAMRMPARGEPAGVLRMVWRRWRCCGPCSWAGVRTAPPGC